MKSQIAIIAVMVLLALGLYLYINPVESETAVPKSVEGSVGYDANRFTMYGNCICADDGMPLGNGVVTYGGDNHKNVTVVKWSGSRQEGKTTTTSSGTYKFQNVLPRGFHIKFTVGNTLFYGNFDEFQEYNLDGALDQPLNMAARGPG